MTDIEKLKQEFAKIEEALQALQGLTGAVSAAARQPLLARKAELEAELSGSGAIAQGNGSTAIGAGGMGIKGNVSDSVLNTGTLYQVYLNAQSKKPGLDEKSFARILHEYFDWVRKAYSRARLYGLESIATTGSQKKRGSSRDFHPAEFAAFFAAAPC